MAREPRRCQQRWRTPTQRKTSSKWLWWPVSGTAAAILIVVIVLFASGVFDEGAGNIEDDLSPGQVKDVVARSHVEGSATAPVTLIEFGDFQCPFCRDFWDEPLATVRGAYVDTGIVKIAFHHMAFLGEESRRAAEASECAADQGKFFEYHDALYLHQGPENEGYLNTARLTAFAQEAGLDLPSFQSCLLDRTHQQDVLDATEHASSIGVRSTPTILVNGKRVANPLELSSLVSAIEAARADP